MKTFPLVLRLKVIIMKNIILTTVFLSSMVGCANTDPALIPIKPTELEVSTYTYLDLDTDKAELWSRARNYIATIYGDSKSVLRVEDKEEGLLVGKGLTSWKMHPDRFSVYCHSEYQIRFLAKDNKARLQLELLEGTPSVSRCVAWTLPSGYGHEQIKAEFLGISKGLEQALRGAGEIDAMDDF